MDDSNLFEAAAITIWIGRKKLKVIFVYNPPKNEPLTNLLEDKLDQSTIILGDFNAPSVRWGYKDTTPSGNCIEEFLDCNPIERLLNNQPTFMSFKGECSTPDLAFAHVGLYDRTKLKILESCTGYGHRIQLVQVRVCTTYNNDFSDTLPRWNLKKADWILYKSLTDSHLTIEKIDLQNPHKSWQSIEKIIKDSALRSIPRGNVRKYRPFWTKEIQILKKSRDDARIKAEFTHSPLDLKNLKDAQAAFKEAVISAKKKCFHDFVESLNFKQDGVKTFRFLAKLKNEGTSIPNEPFIVNGKELVTNQSKANALGKHYASVCRLPRKKCYLLDRPQIGCLNSGEDSLFNLPFTLSEFNRAAAEVNKKKTAGPDNIPTELLINLGDKAKLVLLDFMNSSWRLGIPSDWRKAEIIPVLKKGKSPENLTSFRPISLTNACCKLMERMVANRLNRFLSNNLLLTDLQAGFRKYRSTVEQVAYLSQNIKDGFQRKQSSAAVFIDFKSAYDTVWKKMLIHKLISIGIAGNMLTWIKSFLSQRIARVKYQNCHSKYYQHRNGLPQGSVLSCTLFNIMINDVVTHINQVHGVNCLMYADDLVIYASSSSIPAINDTLNQSMKKLELWCDDNMMTVNINKTVCQLYTLSTKPSELSVKYKDQPICADKSVSYLGIGLDPKLNMKNHVSKVCESAVSRLRLLKRLSGITWGSSQEVLVTTYKTYIRPVLEYGSELLSTASKNVCKDLDKIQNKSLRLITGAPQSTPIAAMEVQVGVEPLGFRRDEATLKLAEKCMRLPVLHWKNYTPASKRLVSQDTFLNKSKVLQKDYDLLWEKREMFPKEENIPLNLIIPKYDLAIGLDNNKKDIMPAILKASSLEVINRRYPSGDWIRIYTDGSADTEKKIAGAGFVIEDFCEESIALGRRASNFDAEIAAIQNAAQKLDAMSCDKLKAVFLIDSQAAILALVSTVPHCDQSVNNTKAKISSLMTSGWTIVYQWIPSHCGTTGNERADFLAKKGSQKPQPSEPVTYKQAVTVIKAAVASKVKEYHLEKSVNKSWEHLITERVPPDLPREVFVANFRWMTGHHYLQSHLYRIGVVDSPICPLCTANEVMDTEHLFSCPKLTSVLDADDPNMWLQRAKIYWAARREMGLSQLPGVR